MPKRLLLVVAALPLLATACVSTTTPPIDYGQGQRFVPFVVDSQDDVGQGSSIALTSNNEPYISYFGFPGELAEGEIAVPRPFGAPTVPFVGLATASTDGLWQRGAVEMQKPIQTQSGVNVPFGPVIEDTLDKALTPQDTNGTSVVLASDGTVHVAWTVGGAVYLASTKLGGTSTVDKVFDSGQDVSQAGPVGKPGIALDSNGDPWVAFTTETSGGREVHVIHPSGSEVVDDVVATLANCNGCGSPQPTGIGLVGGQPLVVYVDGAAGTIGSATFAGGGWKTSTAAPGDSQSPPRGLSFTTDGKGAYAAFYARDSVQVVSLSGGSWETTKVSDATAPAGSSSGNLAATTAVAVDQQGTVYVAWLDQDDGLGLSSGTDSFTPVDIGHTTGSAAGPSLASSGSGVALSWYDTDQQNLMAGFLGDLQGLVVAQPSPSLTLSQAPSPAGETCGKGGGVVLDVIAKGIAFDPTCLVAAPGSFTINFDNQDTNIQHNFDVLDEEGGKSLGATEIAAGPVQQTLDLELEAGTYPFVCDVHPTMTGELVVQDGAK